MTMPRLEPGLVRALAMAVLWPAFLVAGVLEALLFVVVDPAELRWFGGPSLGLSTTAVYTVTFLIIWLLMIVSSGLTALLLRDLSRKGELSGGARDAVEWPTS